MTPLLPLATVILASVLGASFVTLWRDVRGQRVAERVAAIAARRTSGLLQTKERVRNIQVDHRETVGLLRSICRIVKYDPGQPEQYPLPRAFVAMAMAVAFFCSSHVAGMYTSGPVSLCVGMGCAIVCARTIFGNQHDRYANALLRQLPDVVGRITRASQAGVPVGEALRGVVHDAAQPTRNEFDRVLRETALGDGLDVAISRLHRRTGVTEYAFLAITLGMQAQAGGSIAETLDNLADMIRKRVSVAARAKALASEGRTSAVILGALPFVTALGLFFLRPGYLDMFVTTQPGHRMLTLAAALISVGILVIRWLIKRSTAI